MYNFDENDIQKLLGFTLPEEQQSFQMQPPQQLTQGLLGDTGAGQQQNLQELIGSTLEQSAKMAQGSPPIPNSNQNAQMAQAGMQAAFQQQQQQAQAGQMLGKLAKMFLMRGRVNNANS